MLDTKNKKLLIIICSSFNFCERLVKALINPNVYIGIGAELDERYYELCHKIGNNLIYYPFKFNKKSDFRYLFKNVKYYFNMEINFLINSYGLIGDNQNYNYKKLFNTNCLSVINSCDILKELDYKCRILNFVLGDTHNYESCYSIYVGCKFFNLGYLNNFQKSYNGKITNIYINEIESDKIIYCNNKDNYNYLDIIDIVDVVLYYIQNVKLYNGKINLEKREDRLIQK